MGLCDAPSDRDWENSVHMHGDRIVIHRECRDCGEDFEDEIDGFVMHPLCPDCKARLEDQR